MNKRTAWVKDIAHMFGRGALMYLRRTPPRHYLGHVVDGKVPVVLLPGLFAKWAFCKKLADHISLLGHPVYIVPKLGSNIRDIPSSAKLVREVIEENNLKRVILVCHSKGGLISKYLLLHEDPEHRVKGVITTATPFNGSSLAGSKFLLPFAVTRELTTESKIIQYLNSHSGVNKKIVSIIPAYDNYIQNPKGSYLEGALSNVQLDIDGHSRILHDKKVWDIVVEWIEKISHS